MKRILMVQHANGTQERLCPKCPNSVMTFHEGGESNNFDRGDVGFSHTPDYWHCENCGLVIDAEEEKELELVFGGMR